MNERHQAILEIITHKKKVSVNELSQLTNVSVVTIRHDLSQLEQQNYIKRSHGFAELLVRDTLDERMQINFIAKQKLARFALNFIQDGDAIFIEGGSTNSLLARELINFKKEIVVITVCTYIASLLKGADFNVVLLGGLVQSKSETVVGPLTRSCIGLTHFNKVFIGIDGYHTNYGFTGRDMLRAEVINCVLEKGATNIVIADSSKFGQIYSYPLSSNKINHVITNGNLSPEISQNLSAQHIVLYNVD